MNTDNCYWLIRLCNYETISSFIQKKKIYFLFILMFTTSFSNAQFRKDSLYIFNKAITPIGLPAGRQTEFVIDENGGTLKSFDGELELIIPKDALRKKTIISIQPITNMLVLGTGKAYQLEPSNIEFRKPAILKFNVSNEEFRDSLTNLLGIAMQDLQGIWYETFNSRLDSVKRTISCEINHFSVWSKFVALKIYPKYTRLKVGTMLALSLISTRNLFETIQENNTPRGSGLSMSSGGNNESGRKGSNHKNGMSKFELVESIAETGSGNDFPITGSSETPVNTGTTAGKSSGKTGSNVTLTLMGPIELIYVETGNSSGKTGSNVTITILGPIELVEANPGVFEDGEIPLKEVELTIGEAKEVANTGEVELTIGEAKEAANTGEVELTIGEAKKVANAGEVELTIGEATEVTQSGDVELTIGEARRVESDNWEAEWLVNGILNGNSTYGTIQPGSDCQLFLAWYRHLHH